MPDARIDDAPGYRRAVLAQRSTSGSAATKETLLAALAVVVARYTREPELQLGVRNGAGWVVCPATVAPDTSIRDLVAQVTSARTAGAEPSGQQPPVWLAVPGEQDGTVEVHYQPTALPAEPEALAGHLHRLLSDALPDPGRRAGELALLSDQERRQLVEDFNRTAAEYDDHRLVPARVLEWAGRQPDAPALVCGDVTVSYGELAAQARRVAGQLTAIGVGTDTLVGLWMERSPELVVAALGVLLAGGAYVGLDVAEPAVRLAATLEDSGAPVVLTRADRAGQLPRGRAKVLAVEDLVTGAANTGIDARGAPEDLCYVTYTSGSTGVPKGVLIPHQGVTNLVSWYARTFQVGPGDQLPQLARPSFDGWALEVWPALANGATLHLLPGRLPASPSDLADWLRGQGITVCFLTTALAAELFDQPWPAESTKLRAMLVGGEKLYRYPPADLPFRVYNVYGPTETTMLATCGEMRTDAPRHEPPPIGRPLANMRAYVLDEWDQPVPVNAVGELHIGGTGVARGYLGRPELTAQRFRPDPFVDRPDARRYATGDLVRWRPDGQLDFVGRVDEQVKLRGFRIEPGEIETVLRTHPAVRDAVVVVHRGDGTAPVESDGSRLVGYVVPTGAGSLDEVRQHVATALPHFMVPHLLLPLDAVPLTPHGKVDRGSLARRPLPAPEVTPDTAARGDLEKLLAELWREVLELDEVGRDDSFFDLGGDSLQAMRVSARGRERGLRLGAEDLFDHEILSELAEALSTREAQS